MTVAHEPSPALLIKLDSGCLWQGSIEPDSISAIQLVFQVEQPPVSSATPSTPFTQPGKSEVC